MAGDILERRVRGKGGRVAGRGRDRVDGCKVGVGRRRGEGGGGVWDWPAPTSLSCWATTAKTPLTLVLDPPGGGVVGGACGGPARSRLTRPCVARKASSVARQPAVMGPRCSTGALSIARVCSVRRMRSRRRLARSLPLRAPEAAAGAAPAGSSASARSGVTARRRGTRQNWRWRATPFVSNVRAKSSNRSLISLDLRRCVKHGSASQDVSEMALW